MLANISIFPIGKSESLSPFIAEAVKEAERSGMKFHLTDMGTIVEGEWNQILRLVSSMRRRLLKKSGRLYISLTLDDRRGKSRRLGSKVESVRSLLARKKSR